MILANVVIVGSGPAGVGIASLLNQTDIDYVVLEKRDIGHSFLEWPENMEMITPSFPSNAFGQMDLNSICEATSPAFLIGKEHLTGREYSEYLTEVVKYHQLNIQTGTEVKSVRKQQNGWMLETNRGIYFAKYLVWATGEFLNPQMAGIEGAEHCIHSSLVKSTEEEIEGDGFVVVGGYESGVQMAYHLMENGKKVTLINPEEIDNLDTSDPSKVLSPYTTAKYDELADSPLYNEVMGTVVGVAKMEGGYELRLEDGSVIETGEQPICATGFSLVKKPIEDFISYRKDGSPRLNKETDEFLGHSNIYLSGPSVRHDNHIFCFIYKFRLRFGIIAEDILRKEGLEESEISLLIEKWKRHGLYLSDLSCCGDECVC